MILYRFNVIEWNCHWCLCIVWLNLHRCGQMKAVLSFNRFYQLVSFLLLSLFPSSLRFFTSSLRFSFASITWNFCACLNCVNIIFERTALISIVFASIRLHQLYACVCNTHLFNVIMVENVTMTTAQNSFSISIWCPLNLMGKHSRARWQWTTNSHAEKTNW